MGRTAILLAGVVALVFPLGLGLGLFMGKGRTLPEAARQEPAEAALEAEPRPPEEPVAPARAPRSESASREEEKALALAVSLRPPPVEKGGGKIEGAVHTVDGEPLAGVRIRATRNPRPEDDVYPIYRRNQKEPSLEEEVRNLIKSHQWQKAHRQEAQSGADGTFTIGGLVDSPYQLEARLEGYDIHHPIERWGYELRPGDRADFVATPVQEATIAVLLPDGRAPARATIRVEQRRGFNGGNYSGAESWTPREPRIELSAGTHSLIAVVNEGEAGEMASAPLELVVQAGTPLPPITLEVKGRPGIKGLLHFDPQEKFKDVEVWLSRIRPGTTPDPKVLSRQGGGSISNRSRGSSFLFNDLLPGSYVLAASHGRASFLVAEVVEIADRMVEHDLTVPLTDSSESFVLWVRGSQGEALREVEIQTGTKRKGGGGPQGTASSVPRPDGSFLVLHAGGPDEEGEEVTNFVQVRAPGFPPKAVDYRRAETSELTIQLEAPALLEVTVEGYSPAAYGGTLSVSVGEVKGSEGEEVPPGVRRFSPAFRGRRVFSPRRYSFAGGETQDLVNGPVSFGPLDPGSYQVVLQYMSGWQGGFPILTQPVTLQPGKNAVTLAMPPLYVLTVQVNGAKAGSRISLQSGGEGAQQLSISAQTGADSRALFDGLPQGTYTITYQGEGDSGDMQVSIPGQSEVVFQARKLNAMAVTLDDPEGGLARAGLQTGDLIIGLNGATFEDQNGWRGLLRQTRKEKQVKVLIQRGAETLEFSLEPGKLQEGGRLEPASR
jgi:hypothetical protein